MTDTARVPAGWYPDPLGLPQLRWWDNHSWTEHVSDSQVPLGPRETITTQARLAWADAEDERPMPRRSQADSSGVADRLATARPPLQLERAAQPDADLSRPPYHRDAGSAAATASAPVAAAPVAAPAPAPVAAPTIDLSDFEDLLPAGEPSITTSLPAEPTSESAPVDLSALALAVIAARDASDPEVVDLVLTDGSVIRLDPVDNVVWGGPDSSDLAPLLVGAIAHRRSRAGAPTPAQAGRDAEPLLWTIGTRSPLLPADLALEPTARVKLRRWPNLTALEHTPEQLAMTAMLAHAHLTAAELAGLARTTVAESRTLLTAFRVMNLLVRVDDAAAPAVVVAAAAEPEDTGHGLFGRLRRRLGL